MIKNTYHYHDISREEAEKLLQKLNTFYNTGKTRNIAYRKKLLMRLKHAIRKYEPEIQAALNKDLGKSPAEAYLTDIGLLYQNIDYFTRNMEKLSAKVRKPRHMNSIFSKSYLYKEPYGTVLIIAPFNYPFLLLMEPLIAAIASGNNAVVKPSEQAEYTEEIIKKILMEALPEEAAAVVTGGREAVTSLTTSDFDYIFFTGSVSTGKVIMKNAAENLVPVTLELGGKSPAIVARRAEVRNAARKIAYGKFLNAGQTCIAPDYVLAHEEVAEEFLNELRKCLERFYTKDPKSSKDYGRIISRKAYKRLEEFLDADKEHIIIGGERDPKENYISPTILLKEDMNLKVMEEEIFGPILPVIVYRDINKALEEIRPFGKPLAFYIFTEDKVLADKVMERTSFGGGCVNDVLFHITSPHLPFGGVGNSGMGRYHGKYSFDTFTHEKTVLSSGSRLNMRIQEPPITPLMEKLLRKFLK